MAEIFLSYCNTDRDLARKLVSSLETEGISVWWDDRLTPVEQWDRLIEKEIRAANTVLVLWTPQSVESDWVRIEANFGRDQKKLLQARFEGCAVPLQFTLLQWVDLDHWLASGVTDSWRKLITWFRVLIDARAPCQQSAPAPPMTPSLPSVATAIPPEADDFADALANLAREAAESGSGRYDDVAIPELGETWPTFVVDFRLHFGAIEQALTLTAARRVNLFEAGLHLSLYFMRIRDESQSFRSLGLAMRALQAAGKSELHEFLPSLRSVARIAIAQIDPDEVGHYALGRMLGATARYICDFAPDIVKREWLAATSITLSAYGSDARSLTSGFREMSGDAGYSVQIVRFDIPEVAAGFASALLGDKDDANFSQHALKRFNALKPVSEERK